MRSFTVGLAPRSTGRMLMLLAKVSGRTGQEILRSIIQPVVEEDYEAAQARYDLPSPAALGGMTEAEFKHLLYPESRPAPPARKKQERRYIRRPQHAA